MPKPITLAIDVEEIAFGKVWRTLDAMNGVVAIRIKGDGPKKSAKPNGVKGGPTVVMIILQALKHGVKTRSQLMEALEANGKKAASLPEALARLKKAPKAITQFGDKYKITAAGRKAEAAKQE